MAYSICGRSVSYFHITGCIVLDLLGYHLWCYFGICGICVVTGVVACCITCGVTDHTCIGLRWTTGRHLSRAQGVAEGGRKGDTPILLFADEFTHCGDTPSPGVRRRIT